MFIYLDESGDLGWNFDFPYRARGSSRHLTIASVSVPDSLNHMPARTVRKLARRFNWDAKKEKKWSSMSPEERVAFAKSALSLLGKCDQISLHSITVFKENVMEHMREDPNKLYNYMVKLSLAKHMAKHTEVRFFPDNRAIKVESGNSLNDYLSINLTFELNAITKLKTESADSASNPNIQFADMLAGLVQHHFEDGNSEAWKLLAPFISSKKLYFP